jgi:lipopolysaccharide transport system permease protein
LSDSAPKAADGFDLVIEAGHTSARYWRDLWRYRELFYFLAWRDVLVRYKQTTLGIAWAILQPLATMIVGTIIFGRLAKLPDGGVPYPILIYVGMLPWQFFSSALTNAGQSVLSNAQLISKVYFPRLIVPAAAVITSFIDFCIAGVVLVFLMVWYQFSPDWRVLALPLFVMMAFATALGAGLWITALNVKYRDFRFVVPFLVQFGMYLSPVFFSSALVPDRFRFWYGINPMVGVIDGFRWSLLGGKFTLDPASFSLSVALVIVLLASGVWFFRRTERAFADLV